VRSARLLAQKMGEAPQAVSDLIPPVRGAVRPVPHPVP
jgi:hypothetical protein